MSYALNGKLVGDLKYGYDTIGRKLSMSGAMATTVLPAPVSPATYDAANELTTWNGTTLSYDASGNVTSDGLHSYTWNARNQLSAIDSGSTASFVYDPLGRRTTKTILGTTTNLFYDGLDVVQELSGTTPVANLLIGGLDEHFMRTDAAGSRSFLTDNQGGTQVLTDSNGDTQSLYGYDPFGNTVVSGSSTSNSFAYTGRENDSPLGLYYYRARYYNPAVGRFMSQDPIGFAGGINFYAYVDDDPVDQIDPSGLATEKPAPLYDPDRWKDAVKTNNCYSYAWDKRFPPGAESKPQPGALSGKPFKKLTCDSIEGAAMRDGFKKSDGDCCSRGYHKVKLFIGSNIHLPGKAGMTPAVADYHWYRLDSNGMWSSKHGLSPVGPQISDPSADAKAWGYDVDCGTMCAPNQ